MTFKKVDEIWVQILVRVGDGGWDLGLGQSLGGEEEWDDEIWAGFE